MITPFTLAEGAILVKLLISHFLVDFILQTNTIVKAKKEKGIRSYCFWIHVIIVAVVTYFAVGSSYYKGVLIVTFSHALIDIIKIKLEARYKEKTNLLFGADQAAHIIIVCAVWFWYVGNGYERGCRIISFLYQDMKLLLYGLGYIIVAGPVTIIVRMMTEKWSKEVSRTNDGLKEAGKWIGVLERIIIITFVFASQYVAIGFLVAAKSILRLIDKPDAVGVRPQKFSARKHTEYVLIGTFLSFSFALFTGLIIQKILELSH